MSNECNIYEGTCIQKFNIYLVKTELLFCEDVLLSSVRLWCSDNVTKTTCAISSFEFLFCMQSHVLHIFYVYNIMVRIFDVSLMCSYKILNKYHFGGVENCNKLAIFWILYEFHNVISSTTEHPNCFLVLSLKQISDYRYTSSVFTRA